MSLVSNLDAQYSGVYPQFAVEADGGGWLTVYMQSDDNSNGDYNGNSRVVWRVPDDTAPAALMAEAETESDADYAHYARTIALELSKLYRDKIQMPKLRGRCRARGSGLELVLRQGDVRFVAKGTRYEIAHCLAAAAEQYMRTGHAALRGDGTVYVADPEAHRRLVELASAIVF